MELHRIYHPLSAEGFRHDDDYAELTPCPALAPYVRCFWGTATARHRRSAGGLVIPDTCMDLLFEINFSQNRVDGRFCALDSAAYATPPARSDELCATFGIRFYAWSAICFAEDSLSDSMHATPEPERYFSRLWRRIAPALPEIPTLEARARYAERVLLHCLRFDQPRPEVLNAIHAMITLPGVVRISDLASATAVSQRHLERILHEATGASPKLLASLVRHQLVYCELATGRFHPLDAVARYGYADQSHLIRDFRRFHTMTLSEAILRLRR